MKNKLLFFVIFSFLLTGLSADEIDISDYFPNTIGDIWLYANSAGKIVETRNVINKLPDNFANDGTNLYVINNDIEGLDSVAISYSIKNNRVIIAATRDVRGNERIFYEPYSVVLAPPGESWTYFDNGVDYSLRTSKSSCTVGRNTYNDCILVEERVPTDRRNTFRIKRSYFARDIGLVLVTTQTGRRETVLLRLASLTLSIARLWEFEQTNRGLVITNYLGNSLPGSIPETINGIRVVGVETRKPVEDGKQLGIVDFVIKPEEITIPSSITYIGDFTFYHGHLRRVTIPNSVTSIGRSAFAMNNELRNINIPSGVDLKENSFEFGFVGLYNHLQKQGGSYVLSLVETDQWVYAVWTYNNKDYIIILRSKGDSPRYTVPREFNQSPVTAVLKDSGVVLTADSDILSW